MRRYPSRGTAPALEKSAVLFSGPNGLREVLAYNSSSSTAYLQIFDAAALPIDGTVPMMVVQVPSKATASLDWGANYVPMIYGAIAALSTTDTTLTLVGSAYAIFNGLAD